LRKNEELSNSPLDEVLVEKSCYNLLIVKTTKKVVAKYDNQEVQTL